MALRDTIRSHNIVRDGDRKSWDLCAPMKWDNFSIFRTNCAIPTSYIRADARTCLGGSRVDFDSLGDQMVRVARFFTALAGNKNQGSSLHFYPLNQWTRDKVSFSGSKMSLNSRCE